jgi:hypothetical protein
MTGKKSLKKEKGKVAWGSALNAGGNTHPKRLRKPNISTNTPIVGHLRKTRSIPPRKQAVPRSLFLREKK